MISFCIADLFHYIYGNNERFVSLSLHGGIGFPAWGKNVPYVGTRELGGFGVAVCMPVGRWWHE